MRRFVLDVMHDSSVFLSECSKLEEPSARLQVAIALVSSWRKLRLIAYMQHYLSVRVTGWR